MMPLDQKDDLTLRYPGFRSFKAPISIHYRHRYCRTALILDTLDTRFFELQPSSFRSGKYEAGIDCIYRRRTQCGWETLRIGRQTEQSDGEADFALDRGQVKALRGAETARLIWAKRNQIVTLSTRMAVLETVDKEGPLSMGTLLRTINTIGGDPDELLALIAEGTLSIDVRAQISPSMLVHRRGY
jgi:hypothetical protein